MYYSRYNRARARARARVRVGGGAELVAKLWALVEGCCSSAFWDDLTPLGFLVVFPFFLLSLSLLIVSLYLSKLVL